ncbi:MAG: MFS transporter [Alicyclobacillaceae bacterium]|nr:MFS transporter [Alicyclobacillaceae bacterium]
MNTPPAAEPAVFDGTTPADARKSRFGGLFSMFIDTYDIYLPALVLPAVISYFEPSTLPEQTKITLNTLIFAVTLLGRPLGSPIFGNLSDRFGRKRVAMIAAAGFTLFTLIVAVLPGFSSWGYASIGLLIAIRLISGMFLAGGYAAPVPLALERSPRRLRGLIGGLIASGASIAFVVISLIQLIVMSSLSGSAYMVWGWRIPFFVGVLLGIIYLIYYAGIPELDHQYLAQPRRRQPIAELFSGDNLRSIAQVFLLTSGYWFAAQMLVSFLPALLIGVLHQSAANVNRYELYSSALNILVMILFGLMASKVGSRRMMMLVGAWTAVLTTLLYYLMVRSALHGASFLTIGILAFLANSLTSGPLGAVIIYLNERFPTYIRSTGYSVGYSLGLLLPGLYSFWLLWLGHLVPYHYAELILIAFGGLLCLFGAWMGPAPNRQELLEAVPLSGSHQS